MRKFKYFNQIDFTKAVPSCSINDMCIKLLCMIDNAREISGIPYKVLSAHRTYKHEISRGRDGTSSHVKGVAIDIEARTPREKFLVLKGVIEAGFTRVFMYDWGIHVDIDEEKVQKWFRYYGS